MRNATDITIVLDRSGSMERIRLPMESALREFLASQRTGPDECVVSLVRFDSPGSESPYSFIHALQEPWYHRDFTARPITDVPEINICPRGGTALRDAIARVISETGERLAAMPEADRPARVLIGIITDGLENRSVKYTQSEVAAMIQHQQAKYNWQFVYLGSNQDAIAVAKDLGIQPGSAMTYESSAAGVNALRASLSAGTTSYRTNTISARGFFDAPAGAPPAPQTANAAGAPPALPGKTTRRGRKS